MDTKEDIKNYVEKIDHRERLSFVREYIELDITNTKKILDMGIDPQSIESPYVPDLWGARYIKEGPVF